MLSLLGFAALSTALTARLAFTHQRGSRKARDLIERMASGSIGEASSHIDLEAAEPIMAALIAVQTQIAGIVQDVRSGTLAIATSSGQVGTDHTRFAGMMSTLAESLASVNASMGELSQAVANNSNDASRGRQVAKAALSRAALGNEVIERLVHTMGSITGSSRKIGDVISVIDSIAFQINILALNAAVEAARAGEAGRGFSVVAAEVRNLATRSASAAKEVRALIKESSDAVELGAAMVEQTGKTMGDLQDGVQQVAGIIDDIAAAIALQNEGLQSIGSSIEGIDALTRQNASLSKNAAEPVISLHQQALKLVKSVAQFQLGENEYASAEDAYKLVQKGLQLLKNSGPKALISEVNKTDQSTLLDRDLYLVIYSKDAQCVAHGTNSRLVGVDGRNFKDLDGKNFVADIVSAALRQHDGSYCYKWLHPLTQEAMTKSAYFERHGDYVVTCGAYVGGGTH